MRVVGYMFGQLALAGQRHSSSGGTGRLLAEQSSLRRRRCVPKPGIAKRTLGFWPEQVLR